MNDFRRYSWLFLFPLFAILAAIVLPPSEGGAESDPGSDYTYGKASRDGIGKFYMGREISQVMGHRGAAWLERPERQRQERTDLLLANLPLAEDDIVADIGAGTGYFSFPIAGRLPFGKVYAVDIQPQMIDRLERRKSRDGVENIETVLGTQQDPRLPANAVDWILIVDAYHEFSHPVEMTAAMVKALKPGGRLVLVEYRAEDPQVPIKRLHKMSEAQVRREIEPSGLLWETNIKVLPQQHILLFRKPS